MQGQENPQPKKHATTLKLLMLGALSLLLLIPTFFIGDIIRERSSLKESVQFEIGDKWGHEQIITGPIISLPYQLLSTQEDGKILTHRGMMHILPENLNIESDLVPIVKRRGIYEAILYNATSKLTGNFEFSELSARLPKEATPLWDEARISIGISDQRGIKENIVLSLNNKKFETKPGIRGIPNYSNGVSAHLKQFNGENISFSTEISLNGSQRFMVVPLGKTTLFNAHSTWTGPKFMGAFLPEDPILNKEGFEASWKILDFNRNFEQYWNNTTYALSESAFGIEFMEKLTQYQKTERSIKYALLIIALTFASFFFFEVLKKKKIHPIQYTMVGFGLVMFYLLLISLTEHMSFFKAYFLGAAAIIGINSFYFGSITKSSKNAWGMALTCGVLYSFLYVVLTREDYALLIGSIGLFVSLAVMMWITRKIDWYSIKPSQDE
jgi:inner membrane protein